MHCMLCSSSPSTLTCMCFVVPAPSDWQIKQCTVAYSACLIYDMLCVLFMCSHLSLLQYEGGAINFSLSFIGQFKILRWIFMLMAACSCRVYYWLVCSARFHISMLGWKKKITSINHIWLVPNGMLAYAVQPQQIIYIYYRLFPREIALVGWSSSREVPP